MPGYFDDIPAYILNQLFILLNDFICRETRLHNADCVFFTAKPSDMRY